MGNFPAILNAVVPVPDLLTGMGYSRICGLTFVSWVVVLALWTGVRFPMTRESVGSCVQVSLHFRLRRLSHGDMCLERR